MTHEEYALVHGLQNALLEIRDRLDPIAKGEITRGRCPPGSLSPGKRKTTMKDAVSIAKAAQAHIDRIERKFDEEIEQYIK